MNTPNVDKMIGEMYGNRIRTRVCGLCWEDHKLLLANHHGLYGHDFWAPPGGGLEFGQSATENLTREFHEETGLDVQIGEFRFGCEFIQLPLHAVELFFEVRSMGGRLMTGMDPEMGKRKQAITDVKFMTSQEINSLPDKHKHGLFKLAKTAEKVIDLKGYLKI